MLSSSSEYIQALREGKYLLFLEWPYFIAQRYNKGADGDDTANLLIYEWLTNGYSADDAQKLAVLFAVNDLASKPLKGNLDYALNAITVALFLCMVFQKHDLHIPVSQNKLKIDDINLLIKHRVALLEAQVYKDCLNEMQTQFFQWVESADKKLVDAAFAKINLITKPRYLMDDYILHLERVKINHDPLYDARLSMAKRFLSYLYEQKELTPTVSQEITIYVNAIRELNPTKWEVVRLDNISEPSTLEHSWRWATRLGMSFFYVVLQEKSIGECISGAVPK